MAGKIAVVTGGNKGIGLEIVRELCKKFDGIVYLTARDESRGKHAVTLLEGSGLKPKFHQLDIDSLESIEKFKNYIAKNYEGINVLVNNAGISFKMSSTASVAEQAERTMNTNYFGTQNVCNALFPLLKDHARVVNTSSAMGKLSYIPNKELQSKFLSKSLDVKTLNGLMNQYISDCKKGVQEEVGWSTSTYAMSKIAVTALTFIQQRTFNDDSRKDIVVNAYHPGYISTDLSSFKGTGTVEQGAETSVYCALLPPDVKEPRGEFVWEDKTIAAWL